MTQGANLPPAPVEMDGVAITTEGGAIGTIFDPATGRTIGVFVRWHIVPDADVPFPIPLVLQLTNVRAVDELIERLQKHRRNLWGDN